jgi:hypothetical protein
MPARFPLFKGAMIAERVRRGERPAADFVPYSHHVTPTIIATRGGDGVGPRRSR